MAFCKNTTFTSLHFEKYLFTVGKYSKAKISVMGVANGDVSGKLTLFAI